VLTVQDRAAGDFRAAVVFFTPTLDNFIEVERRSDYLLYARTQSEA
jgi:hypothetical protein